MSLWLCQKMSEIHCGGEGSTITNILKSLDQVARFLPCPKFEVNSFSNTHGTQPELL
jgi:copper chaperone CopZ